MLMGEIWSKLSLDTSDFMTNLNKAEAAGSNFSKGGFWQRFAAPALGFTVMYRAMNLLENGFKALSMAAYGTMETLGEFEKQAISASGMLITFAQSKNPFEEYQRILPAVKSLMLDLDRVAARHLVTSEQLRLAWQSFLMKGAPAVTSKSLEDLAIISDTIMLVARRTGSDVTQMRSEIFALMEGENRRGADLYKLLVNIDPQLKEHLNTWRKIGIDAQGNNVVLANIANLLKGMGASANDLGRSWEGVKDTLLSAWQAIQIIGGGGVYETIKNKLNDIVEGYKEGGIHAKLIVDLSVAWSSVLTLIYTLLMNIVQMLGLTTGGLSDAASVVDQISVGINGIFFVFRSIWEISKAIRLAIESAFLFPIQAAISFLQQLFSDMSEMKAIKFLGLKESFQEASGYLGDLNKQFYDLVPDASVSIKTGIDNVSAAFDDMIKNSEYVLYDQKKALSINIDMMKNYQEVLKGVAAAAAKTGGNKPETEKEQRERANALLQAARLEHSMLRDMGLTRRERIYEDARTELEVRKATINKLKLTEQEKDRLLLEAHDAYLSKMKVLDGNYLEGMLQGYREYFADLKTQYEQGQSIVKETLGATQSLFHDSFLNFMKGDLNSFEDVFKSFSDRILDRWSDMLADMVMEWIFGQSQMGKSESSLSGLGGLGGGGGGIVGILGSLIGGLFHEGGVAGMALENLPRLHTGLDPDEFPAILQKGEKVTPKGINGRPQDNAPMFNILIQAADAKSFSDLVRRNPQAVIKPFMDAIERGDKGLLGRLRSA